MGYCNVKLNAFSYLYQLENNKILFNTFRLTHVFKNRLFSRDLKCIMC